MLLQQPQSPFPELNTPSEVMEELSLYAGVPVKVVPMKRKDTGQVHFVLCATIPKEFQNNESGEESIPFAVVVPSHTILDMYLIPNYDTGGFVDADSFNDVDWSKLSEIELDDNLSPIKEKDDDHTNKS